MNIEDSIHFQNSKPKLQAKLSSYNLFTDGSVRHNTGFIAGMLNNGVEVVETFNYSIKEVDNNLVEMLAFLHGIKMLIEHNIRKEISIFTDSLVLVENLNKSTVNQKYKSTILGIKEALSVIEVYNIHLIPRHLNIYADHLTHCE